MLSIHTDGLFFCIHSQVEQQSELFHWIHFWYSRQLVSDLTCWLCNKPLVGCQVSCLWVDKLNRGGAHQPALVEQSRAGSDPCHILKRLGLIRNLWSEVSWKLGSDGSFQIRFWNPVASLTHRMRNFWDFLPPNFTHSLKIMRHAILQEIYLHRARRGNAPPHLLSHGISWRSINQSIIYHCLPYAEVRGEA